MNKFKLPIGDWSADGHQQCEYYIVESNVDFKEIVLTYIEMDEKYKISEICSEYEENQMSTDQIEMIKEAGLNVEDYLGEDYEDHDPEDIYIETDDMAQLVIDFIMLHNDNIELKIVAEDMPMLNNWAGQSITGRGGHVLSIPGYGLFY